ncbi:MAG: hypothetical protein L3J09_10095 [Flavobacteriaceae bacterium]|nr:hypothetical protein [Flavobacteriaceae bacterium]
MFSSGQWTFVVFFVIAFVILMIFSYRKDKAVNKKHYKGSIWILVGFITFVIFLFFLKGWLN